MGGKLSARLLLVGMLLAGGCSRPPGGERALETASLVPISFAGWQEKLAGYRGSVVVVDFWATWCAPCLERFPHMVALYERYKGRGVRFVSVSLDDTGDAGALERAREFLKRHKATFENYLMDENITDAFAKLDLLSIPAVLIYGRDGRLRHKLTGDDPNRQFTSEDVDRALEETLKLD